MEENVRQEAPQLARVALLAKIDAASRSDTPRISFSSYAPICLKTSAWSQRMPIGQKRRRLAAQLWPNRRSH
jgi:hypothetical protein